MLRKVVIGGAIVCLAACGSDSNDRKKGQSGEQDQRPPEQHKPDDKTSAEKPIPTKSPGPEQPLTLIGDYTGKVIDISLGQANFEKRYHLDGKLFQESGTLVAQKDKLLFQPKLYSCRADEANMHLTVDELEREVNHYRDSLIASAYQKKEELLEEQLLLPERVGEVETHIEEQNEVVIAAGNIVDEESEGALALEGQIRDWEQTRIPRAEAAIADKDSELKELNTILVTTNEKITEGEKVVDGAGGKVLVSAEKIDAIVAKQHENQSEIEAAANLVKQKQVEIDQKNSAIRQQGRLISTKQREIANAEDERSRSILLGELRLLLSQKQKMLENLDLLRGQKDELQQKVDSLTVVKSQLAVEMRDAQLNHEKLMDELAVAQGQLTELRRQKEELAERMNEGREVLAAMRAELEGTRQELLETKKRYATFADRLETSRAKLAEEKAELERLIGEHMELQNRLEEMDDVIAEQEKVIVTMEGIDLYQVKDRVQTFKLTRAGLDLSFEGTGSDRLTRVSALDEVTDIAACIDVYAFLFGKPWLQGVESNSTAE